MNERVTMTYDELVAEQQLVDSLIKETEYHALVPQSDPLLKTLTLSSNALLERQAETGYWQFVLEADTTIPAEYIMLQHYLGNVDEDRQRRLADYILEKQLDDGSWPLYEGGPGNISASVKSYLALKLAGHSAEDEALTRARTWILKHGGAENSNVFTRITLAIIILQEGKGIRLHTDKESVDTSLWIPVEIHIPAVQVTGKTKRWIDKRFFLEVVGDVS